MPKFGFDPQQYRARSPLSLVTEATLAQQPELADTPLDWALRYADLGWYVIPVRTDKRPVEGYGLTAATRDPDQIRKIWLNYPQAGIGIACAPSGLVVLDVDPRNGGSTSLIALETKNGVLDSAVRSTTQGGGEHYFFRADNLQAYPGSLGSGLDLNSHGYVLVHPSQGEKGTYSWQPGKDPTQGNALPPAPAYFGVPVSVDTRHKHAPGSLVVAPEVYKELEVALATLDPEDDYNTTWFPVLAGLSRLSDLTRAHGIAKRWSSRSTKPGHTAAAFEDKWRVLTRDHTEYSYQTVFFKADQADAERKWRTQAELATASPDGVHPLALRNSRPSGASEVTLYEFLYDEFMSVGLNVVAGAPGVGKTTIIVPLALAAAHLCPKDFPLRPAIRRNVIIVTESVTQVQRVIYSMAKWGRSNHAEEDFDARVRVVAAQRLSPKLVAQVAADYGQWTHDNRTADGGTYAALPLVVFDTTNAIFDLMNENDNAEVGKAMAALRQEFERFPVILVSHTAKYNGMGESENFTPRGASAWKGDAQGTYTIFRDGEANDAPRVMKAEKTRFPVEYSELTFDYVANQQVHKNVLGYPVQVNFSHTVGRVLANGERAEAKRDAQDAKQDHYDAQLTEDMVRLVHAQPGHARSFYERLPASQGAPRGSQDRKERAVERLLQDGILVKVFLEKPKNRTDHYLKIDEEVLAAKSGGKFSLT